MAPLFPHGKGYPPPKKNRKNTGEPQKFRFPLSSKTISPRPVQFVGLFFDSFSIMTFFGTTTPDSSLIFQTPFFSEFFPVDRHSRVFLFFGRWHEGFQLGSLFPQTQGATCVLQTRTIQAFFRKTFTLLRPVPFLFFLQSRSFHSLTPPF